MGAAAMAIAGALAASLAVFIAGPSCFLDLKGRLTHYIDERDNDGDTIPNYLDKCIDVINVAQADFNDDGIGNACEPAGSNKDEDGIDDTIDWCYTPDNSQAGGHSNTDCEGGFVDHATGGFISEGECLGSIELINDHCDNCPLIANPLQENDPKSGETALDDIGDACEDPKSYGVLGLRMTRVAKYDETTYSETRGFGIPWMETFMDNPWEIDWPYEWAEGYLYYVDTSGPMIAIVPNVYWSRLRSASAQGVMAMLRFTEDPSQIVDREATAGIVLHVENEAAPMSWAYCGIGRYLDGGVPEDAIIIRVLDSTCTDEDCVSGALMNHTNLDVPLVGGGEAPPYYVLQAVAEFESMRCYLRNRLYHGSDEGDVLAEVDAMINRTSSSVVGLRAQGIATAFKAAALFRN